MADTRHDQLIAAGWRYDAASDMYAAPGSATDGTARHYNQAAAWAEQQALAAQADTKPAGPAVRKQRDPRAQEPE